MYIGQSTICISDIATLSHNDVVTTSVNWHMAAASPVSHLFATLSDMCYEYLLHIRHQRLPYFYESAIILIIFNVMKLINSSN
jgi:hypothetical protein